MDREVGRTVYVYCDESGAKGYADQGEGTPGEVGVFAGILVPGSRHADVGAVFNEIASRYAPASGKLHIADLEPQLQMELRQELFDAISDAGLPCFWYAIHVEGLHHAHLRNQASQLALRTALADARGGVAPRVKQGSVREDPESMHAQLFAGLFSHVVAFLKERQRSGMAIDVRTDRVDAPLERSFLEAAQELLRDSDVTRQSSGFDTVERKVVHGSVSIEVQWPADYDVSSVVKSVSIQAMPDDDGLTLAADVLANSLNYLFKSRSEDSIYGPLNCREAVVGHPLFRHLDAFSDWGMGDIVGDQIYAHPNWHPG